VSRYETEDERDEFNNPVMTIPHLRRLLKKNQNLYYVTPEVNDLLYLHYKGYKEFKNMDMFP